MESSQIFFSPHQEAAQSATVTHDLRQLRRFRVLRLLEKRAPVFEPFLDPFLLALFARFVVPAALGEVGLRYVGALVVVAVLITFVAKGFFCALASAVAVTRSIKFDGAIADRKNPATQRLAALAGILETDQVFLAGSTQEPEESLAVAVFSKLVAKHPSLRLILVPRHAERFEAVARMLEKSGLPWQRRSTLETAGLKHHSRILLVDVIGELAAWWGTAQIAFVGGSLGKRGGQNMIEPAAYGAAVSFGPNTWNFRDVVEMLLAREAAVVVQDGTELEGLVRRCLENPEYARVLGQNARTLVLEQLGAADRTVELLSSIVDVRRASRSAA